ncbi:hypothetical protein M514_21729 [Trichuris suis]|uniref:Uncharacterized protein n=1 Tax=Trichuris suis TaxID=68888 RepID=A0A085N9A7_9BILA|nr:hypothetical protein M514_21729 [Trichuris suis]
MSMLTIFRSLPPPLSLLIFLLWQVYIASSIFLRLKLGSWQNLLKLGSEFATCPTVADAATISSIGGGQNPESRNPDRSKSRQSKSRTGQNPEGPKSRMGQNPEGSKSRIGRKCTVKLQLCIDI